MSGQWINKTHCRAASHSNCSPHESGEARKSLLRAPSSDRDRGTPQLSSHCMTPCTFYEKKKLLMNLPAHWKSFGTLAVIEVYGTHTTTTAHIFREQEKRRHLYEEITNLGMHHLDNFNRKITHQVKILVSAQNTVYPALHQDFWATRPVLGRPQLGAQREGDWLA